MEVAAEDDGRMALMGKTSSKDGDDSRFCQENSDRSNRRRSPALMSFRSLVLTVLLVLAITVVIFNSCWRYPSVVDVVSMPAQQLWYNRRDKQHPRAPDNENALRSLNSTAASAATPLPLLPDGSPAVRWWSSTALTDPKVRVISMVSRGDYGRLGSFMAHWDLHNISFLPKPALFHAIDVARIPPEEMWFGRTDLKASYYYSSAGAYGCLLSHLHLMKEHEAENRNRHGSEVEKYSDLVIFEDDAAFIDGFEEILIGTLRDNKVALSDWDFFYLGGTAWRPPMVNASEVGYFKLETMGNTHAYMVKGKSIRRIVQYIESKKDVLPIDIVYSNLMAQKVMNGYSTSTLLSGQMDDAGSVINSREMSFAKGAQNTMTIGCGFMNMLGEFCDQCADKAHVNGGPCGACCGPYTYRVRHAVFNPASGASTIVPGEVIRH